MRFYSPTRPEDLIIDWQGTYIVSKSLTLEISPGAPLLGVCSVSRPPQEVALDALPVLLAFASGSTPQDALAGLEQEWEIDSAGFEIVVDTLLEQNFLTPIGEQARPRLAAEGFASLHSHHRMLRDPVRVMSYQAAIARHCRDRVVVEIGCGSGILSIFAAKAGARKVIAIEESEIASLASRMFKANDCADVVELKLGNSRDIELDEKADVVVHEILGVDPLVENILPFIADARRRFLKPGGRLLPHRLEIGCVGLELEQETYRDKHRVCAEAREFAALYGVDFAPYQELLAELPSSQFRPPVPLEAEGAFSPKVLSGECLLLDIDLSQDAGLAVSPRQVKLPIHKAGTLSGVALFFRAFLDDETKLSTSPFAPRTSWGYDVRWLSGARQVEPGDQAPLAVEVKSWVGKQRLAVDWVDAAETAESAAD